MREQRLTKFARSMRKEMTESETRLWFALRAKRFEGIKFCRQKVIDPYIADFCSNEPMLVIEIDGDSHGYQEGYDDARSRYLIDRGYQVLRFTNVDMMSNLEGVLTVIIETITPLPTLSPERERA
ncbi:MAG: endonuclease domain-containing protein [Alphaproteobacteria bacterium]|nr:endonuclease domain-containing protein [Alphaproteobacteria bacterium]